LASITGPNFGAGNYTAGTVLNWNQQSAGPFIDAVKDALGGNLFVGAKVDNVSESVTSRSFYFLSAAESGAASPKLTIKYTDASVFTPFGIGVGTFDGDLSLSA